jgi:phosphoserine phosphatase
MNPNEVGRCLPAAPGWSGEVRAKLDEIIRAGAGKGLTAVFDFDNTLVWGDIGEATLAVLVRDGVLSLHQLAPDLAPAFHLADGTKVAPGTVPDLTRYYEALLDPTVHGPEDPTPLANGYTWAVEVMRGLTLDQVTSAVRKAWDLSRAGHATRIEISPGGSAFPVPFFYPEMVELLGQLLRHEFEVWIFSASNVWSVRWVVSRILNPLLFRHGAPHGIAADHVVGVSALLASPDGGLQKESVLVRVDPAYASLDESRLAGLRLTRWLHFPVPTYSGKVAAIWDALGHKPFLGAGDSPGDLPMLSFCEHRLWIDRVEKPGYRAAMERVRERFPGNWLAQPVRTQAPPGFIQG